MTTFTPETILNRLSLTLPYYLFEIPTLHSTDSVEVVDAYTSLTSWSLCSFYCILVDHASLIILSYVLVHLYINHRNVV